MKIGNNNIESVIITTLDNEVIVIISDNEIVEKQGYKVILEPTKQ